MNQTANGSFEISLQQADEIRIVGTGSEVVTGNDSIKVETVVTTSEFYTNIIY